MGSRRVGRDAEVEQAMQGPVIHLWATTSVTDDRVMCGVWREGDRATYGRSVEPRSTPATCLACRAIAPQRGVTP